MLKLDRISIEVTQKSFTEQVSDRSRTLNHEGRSLVLKLDSFYARHLKISLAILRNSLIKPALYRYKYILLR